jgi:NADPH:quinone reductase
MSTMKAVCMHACGEPEVLKLEEVEVPQPPDGEVRVRVRTAGVNPFDYKLRSGAFSQGRPLEDPVILGRDVAARSSRAGPQRFRPGGRITVTYCALRIAARTAASKPTRI